MSLYASFIKSFPGREDLRNFVDLCLNKIYLVNINKIVRVGPNFNPNSLYNKIYLPGQVALVDNVNLEQ